MKLFNQSIYRGLSQLTGGIAFLILTLVSIFMVLRVINYANNGTIAQEQILLFLSLTIVNYLPYIIVGSIFIACMTLLNRLYEQHEMLIWQSSGLSLWHFIPALLKFCLPAFIMLLVVTHLIWPWSNQNIAQLKQQMQDKNDFSFLLEGQFFEIANSKKVLFIEQINLENEQLQAIFLSDGNPQKPDIITALKAEKIEKFNRPHIRLQQGQRYVFNLQTKQMQSIAFEQLDLPIQAAYSTNKKIDDLPIKAQSTKQLLQHIKAGNTQTEQAGELSWRFSLPMMVLIVPFLALALSYQHPRKTKYLPTFFAILLYLSYSNLINLSDVWLKKQHIGFMQSIYLIHVIVLVTALCVLFMRTHGIYKLYKLNALRRF